jgi:F-type H+-transporting ATPase subunit gamma
MADLKAVRERIKSVMSTQQITKAMKMVSAAKLRRAQQAITQLRPYSNKLDSMLSNLLSNLGSDANTSFGVVRPVESVCIVVVTSNRGLCGAFNTNVTKSAIANINQKYSAQLAAGKLTILPIGKRGADVMRRTYPNATVISDYVDIFSSLTSENTTRISQMLMDSFAAKKFDAVEVSYGRFKNAGMQFAETERFLPVLLNNEAGANTIAAGTSKKRADYLFEPDQNSLLEHLIPTILHTQFLKYNLDTHASEHGARMTAMDKATENADEMLKALKISYNKARQESITKELSEIVGGAAALEG